MQKELVVLGVLISLAFGEVTGLSPGLIVPGFLCLYLHSPGRLGLTLAISLLCALLGMLLRRWLYLYGRRQFALMIALSFGLDALLGLLLPAAWRVGAVGTLIPGILANACLRQGIGKTLTALALCMALIVLAGYLLLGVKLL